MNRRTKGSCSMSHPEHAPSVLQPGFWAITVIALSNRRYRLSYSRTFVQRAGAPAPAPRCQPCKPAVIFASDTG
ncbi:hypothetical protein SPHINGO361_100546 [Sphingomonas sp. EC-HK361]|nr:hypothetical protein SPHINGO361_100546 [Sphingomonas sp. EC-HK361]